METITSTKSSKKKQNVIVRYFSAYFEDFGLRQIATVLLLIAGIVSIVGVSIAHEVVTLVGFYLALAAALCGVAESVAIMIRVKYRKAPAFKRALINLIVMLVVVGIALTGIIFTHVNGIYA